jgi:hypothetical protein
MSDHQPSKFLVAFGMLTSLVVSIACNSPVLAASSPRLARIYDAISKLPDFSGTWEVDARPSVLQTDAAIPLTPQYAARLAELRRTVKSGGALPGNPACRPIGMPLYMSQSGPLLNIALAPGRVIMTAGSQEYRVINTDGRELPKDTDIDQFDGASVGHWEGNVLSVDTVGILEDAQIFPGIENGGGLQIKERIHLIGPDKLQDDITLISSTAFTAPYAYTATLTRHREWNVSDYVCLTQTQANYGVGRKMTDAEEMMATDRKPPVRQAAKPVPNAVSLPGGSWQSIAELPDWFGPWAYDERGPETSTSEFVPLTPPYAQYLAKIRQIHNSTGDVPSDIYHCRPRGTLQLMKTGGATFFLAFTPGQVTLVPEHGQARYIFTDGRVHPANLEPSFSGHSIGHWEGERLVVDTIGFRPDVQMMYGVPGGENTRLNENIYLVSNNRIQIDSIQTNPITLTEPWHYFRTFSRRPNWDLIEQYCTQNNRDVHPESFMQQFDLTPPSAQTPPSSAQR